MTIQYHINYNLAVYYLLHLPFALYNIHKNLYIVNIFQDLLHIFMRVAVEFMLN